MDSQEKESPAEKLEEQVSEFHFFNHCSLIVLKIFLGVFDVINESR